MPRHHRLSRGLIGLLLVTIALGLVFYLNNVSRSRASEAPVPTVQPPASEGRAPSITPAPAPVVTRTPTPTPAPVAQAQPSQPAPTPPSQNPLATAGPTGSGTSTARPSVFADARAKRDAGQLVAARAILNDALLTGTLSSSESAAARRLIAELNDSVIFSPKRFADDPFTATHTVQSGELLRTIANRCEVPWELLARINGISDPRRLRAGQTIKLVRGPFHAVVTKSTFTMDIYLGPPGEKGSMYVMSFPVGLGENDSTPAGIWLVETHKKLKNPTYFSPRGEGIIDADDPKNPLGERWIGLAGIDGGAVGQQSYGIHGTIEPETIGRQASLGCIRMHNEHVELVFDLLVEGKSTVIVRE